MNVTVQNSSSSCGHVLYINAGLAVTTMVKPYIQRCLSHLRFRLRNNLYLLPLFCLLKLIMLLRSYLILFTGWLLNLSVGSELVNENVYEIKGSVIFSDDIVEHCQNATYDVGTILEKFNQTAEKILLDNPSAEWMQSQRAGRVFKLGMSGLHTRAAISPREAMEDVATRLRHRIDTICGRTHTVPIVESDELFPYSRIPRVKELYALGWLLNSLVAPFVMKVESVFITPSEWAGLHIPVGSERISISASMLTCEHDKIHVSVCVNYVLLNQVYPLYSLSDSMRGINTPPFAVKMNKKLYLIKDECEEHDTGVVDGDDENDDYYEETHSGTLIPHECPKKPTDDEGYDFSTDGCRFCGFLPKETLLSSPVSMSDCMFDDFAHNRTFTIRERFTWPSDLLSRRRTSAFADDPSSLVGMTMDGFMKDVSSPLSDAEKIANHTKQASVSSVQPTKQRLHDMQKKSAPVTVGLSKWMWALGILLLVASICANVVLLDWNYGQQLRCNEASEEAFNDAATTDNRMLIV